MARLKSLLKSRSKAVPEVVAGKLALKFAELDIREKSLSEESRRIHDEMKVVSAEKAETLRLLTAGMNGDSPTAKDSVDSEDDKKESVYRLIVTKPSHVFPTAEVIKALGLNRSTASVYLSELAQKDKRIARISKGKYQALQSAIPVPAAIRSATAKEYSTGSTPDRVLTLLNSEPETTFTAQEIGARFGWDKAGTDAIRNALSRLARDLQIEKVAHGKYLAQPGRRKM